MALEREEAIGNLEYAKRWKDRPTDETIDMAIKALKREPKFIVKSDGTIEQIKNCDDCIFRKEWEKIGKSLSVILKKQTEQEPCEDAISRQAVTDTTICDGISCNECSFNTCEDGQAGCLLKERVDKLPPVTPQYTDAEIQKMQELEQAEIKKAYELGKADVLDKIRAEIHATAEIHEDGDYYLRDEWIDEIIDKYKAENEEGRE